MEPEPWRLLRMGERGWLIEHPLPLAVLGAVRAANLPGVVELVPAERTVLAQFGPEVPVLWAEGALARVLAGMSSGAQPLPPAVGGVREVHVRYQGPELLPLAAALGMTPDELVRRHTAADWTVAFVGFSPGFGYLTSPGWDFDIPRLAEPRTAVPSGAVAVAGRYGGVYPRSSPGGWQLIGETDAVLWDPKDPAPALFVPGATVRFMERR